MELQLVFLVEVLQFLEKEPTVQTGKRAYRQKESFPAGQPSRILERYSHSCYDTVEVGMMHEVLSPGVKYCEESDFCAEMLRRV